MKFVKNYGKTNPHKTRVLISISFILLKVKVRIQIQFRSILDNKILDSKMLNSKIVFSEFPQQERKEKDLDDKVAQAITHQLQRIANHYVAIICLIEG